MADNNKEKDPISGVETTGHEWDGLKELNNPLPRWWLWVFIVTCIWAVGYWVVYPAWPTISGHTQGNKGWTQYSQLKEQQAEIVARQEKYLARFEKAPIEQIQSDPELFEFAKAGGAAAFKQQCATCHGTGAAGGKGYPNLNDDDWLWGGKLEDIYHSIKVGIRSSHPDTRQSQMPSFAKDGILKRSEISDVTEYVMKLKDSASAEKNDAYNRGTEIFKNNCTSCHGEDGKGGREFGAPNLADSIWLYGGDVKAVTESVSNAHAGVMPTWENKLSDTTIKQLAIYVHSLGGGE